MQRSQAAGIATRLGALLVALPLCLAAAGPGRARAESRVALVIGNGGYEWAPLRNPPNDARDMAAVLRTLDFDVTEKVDLDRRGMKQAIREFGRVLRERGGVGLFYFAGHGMQVDGRNYLIPVGSLVESEADVDIEGVRADELMAKLSNARNRMNIVILDACRNNPFERSFRSATRGLAFMSAPAETLVAYSTAPGSVAADAGGSGGNGVYTEHLVKAMQTPGLELYDVFRVTRREVKRATKQAQDPWESSNLTQKFYFVDGGARLARPRDAAGETPGPPGAGFSLDDLASRADRDARAKKGWSAYLDAMRADFAESEAFAGRDAAVDLKVQAWQRFLGAYPEDDPYSQQDEALRQRAEKQLARVVRQLESDDVSSGADMVEIPDGEFVYGMQKQQSLPGFRIDRTEVTVAAYRECVAAGGCSEPSSEEKHCNWSAADRERYPVNCVDWYQARSYCDWRGARLPSEHEWEKAARGTDGRRYPWGRDWNARLANTSGKKDGFSQTSPVGSFPDGRSPYGALDMVGNVWEWTADRYAGAMKQRVLRGGSWKQRSWQVRTFSRNWSTPTNRSDRIGFRCAD